MDFLEINLSGEPGMAIIAMVAFGGGLIRGFTGFGGPAFILAILTLFFTPYSNQIKHPGYAPKDTFRNLR